MWYTGYGKIVCFNKQVPLKIISLYLKKLTRDENYQKHNIGKQGNIKYKEGLNKHMNYYPHTMNWYWNIQLLRHNIFQLF